MFDWTPSLEIGVDEIDAQHRALFELAGEFAVAVRARERYDRLEKLFAFLSRYTLEHFAAEERFMRDVGYPGLADQVVEHREFKRRLDSLVPQWTSEGESAAMLLAMLGFLDSWLTEHIAVRDRRIGDYTRR